MIVDLSGRLATVEDVARVARARRARKRLEFDLSRSTWVSPVAVVAVLASSLRAQRQGILASVVLPDDPEVRSYLYAIGFFDELARQGWVDSAQLRHTTGEIGPNLPVTPLSTSREVEIASEHLWDALHSAGIPTAFFHSVLDVAVELTHNAREHGSDCYVVAQTHTGRRSGTPGIHVAVADVGPGFAATLRDRYGRLPDDRAIMLAFEEGVSGTGRADRGFGLGYALEAITGISGAELHLWSGRGHAICTGDRFELSQIDLSPGTVASAYFPYEGV